jgi:hypothetical protein
MKKKLQITLTIIFSGSLIFAADGTTTATSGGGIDWVQTIFAGSYIVAVFLLLPIVVYTNLKEGVFVPGEDDDEQIKPIQDLSEEERNERSREILEEIEQKLTPYETEEGEELITITKASQARFMKHGLDYINKRLAPTDPVIIDRVHEFIEVYQGRAARVFTGSKWVLGCAVGVGVFVILVAGFTSFLIIHALGILFYYLSSRTTMYGLEKRMQYFGKGSGAISRIMSALFIGDGTKYYVRRGGGPWERDWETEGQMALISMVILFFAALILGFFAALLGVLNFLMNYSRSYILPFGTLDDWFKNNFEAGKAHETINEKEGVSTVS